MSMMPMPFRLSAIALLVVCCLNCGGGADAELAASDRQALEAAFGRYLAAANATDAAAWASLYTADAVMMPPNTPAIEGRSDIEAWLSTLPVIQDATGTAVEIAGLGNAAYVRGTYSMALVIPTLAQPLTQKGKLLHVYARQEDGSWLLARDIWNADAP